METGGGHNNVDVVVIGAGLSGLTTARNLHKEGVSVVVLEARDRVGGRTLTMKHKDHGTVDVGGAYVGPTQDRVLNLIEELGLETYKVDESDDTVLNLMNSWKKFKGSIPPFRNPFKILDINHIIRVLEDMSAEVPPASPWAAKHAQEWDSMTFQQFLDKTCWTRTAQSLVTIFVQSVLCAEPCEVSLLFVLWYIRQGGGVDRLSSITNGAQERKVSGGTQQMSQLMAQALGDRVRLSSPVVSVTQTSDDVRCLVQDAKGHTYKCQYVICAVPPPLLLRIKFTPPLPDLKQQLIQRMPMGSVIKTFMYYKTAFWRQLGLNGIAVSDHGPIAYCIDDTKPDGSHPAIMGFVLADQARELTQLSPIERKQALCEHYTKTFGDADFLKPIGYEEKNWMEEEYSGGCYTSIMPPGAITGYGRLLRTSIGSIFFAGTETATRWRGYMDGAIRSGERAATEVLHRMGKRQASLPDLVDNYDTNYGVRGLERYLPSVGRLFKICMGLALYMALYWTRPYFYGWRGYFTWRYINYWD